MPNFSPVDEWISTTGESAWTLEAAAKATTSSSADDLASKLTYATPTMILEYLTWLPGLNQARERPNCRVDASLR